MLVWRVWAQLKKIIQGKQKETLALNLEWQTQTLPIQFKWEIAFSLAVTWIFLRDRHACILRCASLASPGPSSPPSAHTALGWDCSSPSHPCATQITSAPGLRNKAQSELKCSRKRRKVIKGNLMAQQTLLGSLLKWVWLFWPYQSQLWEFPCCCSS